MVHANGLRQERPAYRFRIRSLDSARCSNIGLGLVRIGWREKDGHRPGKRSAAAHYLFSNWIERCLHWAFSSLLLKWTVCSWILIRLCYGQTETQAIQILETRRPTDLLECG